MYNVFKLLVVTRVIFPSICFFDKICSSKYYWSQEICYRDIKKWQTEIVTFYYEFSILMSAVNYIERL